MMAGVTRGLSDADIANLSAYYAGQRCEAIPEGGTKP
jgi:cytochrome c553